MGGGGAINIVQSTIDTIHRFIYRGSYRSAHVLLDLLNSLRKRDKMLGEPRILSLSPTRFSQRV